MTSTDPRYQKNRRNLRALLFLGLFIAAFEIMAGAVLLYFYWSRLPTATVATWQLWQLLLIHGSVALFLLFGIFFITRLFIDHQTNAAGDLRLAPGAELDQ